MRQGNDPSLAIGCPGTQLVIAQSGIDKNRSPRVDTRPFPSEARDSFQRFPRDYVGEIQNASEAALENSEISTGKGEIT
jgi:hypothetical protein